MKFIVTGYDYTDAGALERRMDARESHMAGIMHLKEEKKVLYAAAMLNEKEVMCGSVIIVDFEDKKALDQWLSLEAYIVNKVWEKVDIKPCKVPPMFL